MAGAPLTIFFGSPLSFIVYRIQPAHPTILQSELTKETDKRNMMNIYHSMKKSRVSLPGVNDIEVVTRCKVPIIKCRHEFFQMNVDISMNNL